MDKDILLALFVAAFVAAIIYFQVQKITHKIDQESSDEMSENFANKYTKFCESINDELENLQNLLKDDENFLNLNEKDSILEALSGLNRDLVFIQTMYRNNQNSQIWENKLFEFLSKMDKFILSSLKNGEEISSKIKSNLQKEFQML